MIHQLKYFDVEELVDKETFAKFGEDSLRYFRPEILKALEWAREHYPIAAGGKRSMTVNDWKVGGSHQWRGLRTPACPEYKPHSGHSWGAAVDCVPAGIPMEGFRQWLLHEHADALQLQDHLNGSLAGFVNEPLLLIRRLEVGTPTWVHLDCLEHSKPGIWLVNP